MSAFEDGYSDTLPFDTKILMRDLGILSVSTDVSARYGAATRQADEMVLTARAIAKDLNDTGQAKAEGARNDMIGVGLVAIIVGLTFGFFLARLISRGVTHITDVATQAAHGELHARATMDSQDELGQMATAFNMMLDRITALVQTEEERDVLQRRLMEFLVMVSEVSKGDLTRRGAVTADMFGNLADAFNLMLDRFGKLLGQAREAAGRVSESNDDSPGLGELADMKVATFQENPGACRRTDRSSQGPEACPPEWRGAGRSQPVGERPRLLPGRRGV